MSVGDLNPPLTELVAARDVLERQLKRVHRRIRGDGHPDDASTVADYNRLDTRIHFIDKELLLRAIFLAERFATCDHDVPLGQMCDDCRLPRGTK